MNLTPAQVAATDQELAAFAETLGRMLTDWPEFADLGAAAISIGAWARAHASLTHQQALLLLAVAVERLAQPPPPA